MLHKKIILGCIISLLLTLSLDAKEEKSKRTLKSNYQLLYNIQPDHVNNFSDMFSHGKFYGRLRSNSFYYFWNKEDATHTTHFASGIGGSLLYRSAVYKGIDTRVGLYYSKSFFNANQDPVNSLKAGKDTLSRFNYTNTGTHSMAMIGEAYIRYRGAWDTGIRIGRQIIETFYTKSNDSKMIPNTFDAVTFCSRAIPHTPIIISYITAQKLRDHSEVHSVLSYGDSASSSLDNPQWTENDDSAMHKGLTFSALQNAGKDTNAPLITGDIHNDTFESLRLNASFYSVPKLLGQMMLEANYQIDFDGFSVTPAMRYIRQFDQGAGAIAGASYQNDTTGYTNPNSLNSQMIAGKLVAHIQDYKLNIAYSKIFDEADLISPWRGFPTSGYTRSMGRYNWRANTQSYRIEMVHNANATAKEDELFTQASILYTNGDESKRGSHIADEIYYYLGFAQNIPKLDNIQWRLRLGYTQYLDSEEHQYNNLDGRFELNYLF